MTCQTEIIKAIKEGIVFNSRWSIHV